MPTTGPSVSEEVDAEDQLTIPKPPSPYRYLEASQDQFVSMPGTISSREPVAGESFDGEITIAAGLMVAGDSGADNSMSKEGHLLQVMGDNFRQLEELHLARKEKLDVPQAIVDAAEASFE
ncbi:hypothetical protein ZWY2020_054875 [Hordeum vulgare]|nr:hypothetical protein ZWY2020_054875 [Hordeum vulgare]